MNVLLPGSRIYVTCYKEGCEDTTFYVTLGRTHEIHPTFRVSGRVGRLTWPPTARMQGFTLSEMFGGSGSVTCPKCHTLLGKVIRATWEGGELAFGYDPEPA